MSLCCLRPASKYSGCRLRQERPGSALLDKKRQTDGERWAIADLQTPADPSPRSCRGEPPGPSEQASKQPRAGTGVHRARGPQRSSPTRTEAKASPAHRHRRSIVLRGAGHSAPEVNGQEAPGAARSPGGRVEAGRARRPSFPAASPLPAARAAVPRTPTPRAASPPPRRAAGWT